MDARIIAAGDAPAGREHVIDQRIDLPLCQRIIEAITIGKLLRLQIRRQQTQRQVILQDADTLAAQVAPVRQRVGLQAVDAPQRAPHRQRAALAIAAAGQRLHQLNQRLAVRHPIACLLRVIHPQRFKAQSGALSDGVQQIDAVAARLAAVAAVAPGVVVRQRAVDNVRMPPQPGFFHCRQVQRIGVQIARQLRAPAALNAIDDLDRQLANSLIQRIAQRSLRGNGIQTQFARIDRRGDLIDLSLLQLAEKKAGAGFIRHHIIILLIQQGIERLQITAVASPAVAGRQRRRQLCQRAFADRQLGILAVKHHGTLVLLIAVDPKRTAVPVIAAQGAGWQGGNPHAKRKIDLAAVQRLHQMRLIAVEVEAELRARQLSQGGKIVGIDAIQIVADAHRPGGVVLFQQAHTQDFALHGFRVCHWQHHRQIDAAHRTHLSQNRATQQQQHQQESSHCCAFHRSASSTTERVPVFSRMFFLWVLTVLLLMCNWAAICRLDRPLASSARI